MCQEHNVRPVQKPEPGEFKVPEGPGKSIVIGFTDMGIRALGKRYLVDEYLRWVKAYLTGKQDAKTVIKCGKGRKSKCWC